MGKMNDVRLPLLLTILLLTVMPADAAEAQEGFYLGAEMVFVDIGGTVNPGDTIASGDGAGITAGYGISRNFSIEAGYQKTAHSVSDGRMIDLTVGSVGLKASLQLAGSYFEPFLVVGIGKYTLDARRGDGWRCGAGVDISLSPAFTLTMGLSRHFIDLDPAPKVSGDITSMEIGIDYHFQ